MVKLSEIIFSRPKLKSLLTVGAYVTLMVIAAFLFKKYVNEENLQEIVKASGNFGVVLYFLIEVVYVAFAPLLNTFILIFSGYIFGGHTGFIINFLSTSVGLFLIIFLVKIYGRPLLQKIISPKYYKNFDKITQKIGPTALLIVYVLPFTPDDELTYIVAAGPIKFERFILPIILGTIAKSAYSYIGALGTKGISIAVYFRITLLIVGVIAISLQEYFIKKRNVKDAS